MSQSPFIWNAPTRYQRHSVWTEVWAVLLAIVIMSVVLLMVGCTPPPVDAHPKDIAPNQEQTNPPVDILPHFNNLFPVASSAASTAIVPIEGASVPSVAVSTTPLLNNNSGGSGAIYKSDPHPRAGQHKHVLIQQSRYVWGLNAPVSSFAAQIHQESRWNPSAKSPVGAAGLTQFMPATARWIGTYDAQLASVDVYNPRWAMRALAVYDKFLYDKVGGVNPCERMAFALSAYNGGLGWVNKRKARSGMPNVCFGATCEINPGISASNQRENSNYPELILKQFEPLYVRAGWGQGVCQ